MADEKPPEGLPQFEIETGVDLASLHLDERNPRKGDIAQIADSLRELGQHRPLVVQRSTRKILAGNHMYQAMIMLGWTTGMVLWTDDDDKTAIRRALADNFTSDKSTYDDDIMKELLLELGGHEANVPGLDDKLVSKLLDETARGRKDSVAYPIVQRLGEEYDYVVVVATNEIDAAWLHTKFTVRRESSYKSSDIGRSRVVTVDRLRKEWLDEEGDAATE